MKNSINQTARIGGVLYLVLIVVGLFSVLIIKDRFIVSGDVTATANHIIRSQFLWRMALVADLIMHVLDIPIMLIIYLLLKPVNKNLALLALLFTLIQTAVLVANNLNLYAALIPLEDKEYLKNLDQNALHVQAYLSLKLNDIGFKVGLIFFGCACLINGYLIFKSGYLPKLIGVLIQVAGLCYLINSLLGLLEPAAAKILFIIPCLVAELSFCLWLIVKGVNVDKWQQKVNALQVNAE